MINLRASRKQLTGRQRHWVGADLISCWTRHVGKPSRCCLIDAIPACPRQRFNRSPPFSIARRRIIPGCDDCSRPKRLGIAKGLRFSAHPARRFRPSNSARTPYSLRHSTNQGYSWRSSTRTIKARGKRAQQGLFMCPGDPDNPFWLNLHGIPPAARTLGFMYKVVLPSP